MKISNAKELKEVSLTVESYDTRNEWIFEGIKIDEKESEELSRIFLNYDPIDVKFINCQFNDSSFCSIFNGPIGVVNVSVLDSKLTVIQAESLINNAANAILKTLNLSNNCLGDDEAAFFNKLKEIFNTIPSLSTLTISNNGISKKASEDFENYIKKTYNGDFTVIN